MSVSNIKLGAVFVGWITCIFLLFAASILAIGIVLAFGIDYESLSQTTDQFTALSFALIIYFAVFICFFTGGYVAGRMASYSGTLNGALIIAINLIVISLIGEFIVIVGNKLDFDITSPILQIIDAQKIAIFVSSLVAFAGSTLGGKFGEGYVSRLDTAIGLKQQSAKKKVT